MKLTSLFCFLLFCAYLGVAQTSNDNSELAVKRLIEKLKTDPRGPYKDIRWFCPDGTIIAPKEQCKDPGGYQRARYKDEVQQLADQQRIYLGPILTGMEFEDFYDASFDHSRMKQYVLNQYLQILDDGWTNQKAKFYRGAIQAEDEAKWGRDFLQWVLEEDRFSEEKFFLIREVAKFIPHGNDSNIQLDIRTISKNISDRQPAFMDLRTKIHGTPGPEDIQSTQAFKGEKTRSWSRTDVADLDLLIDRMQEFYSADLSQQLAPLLKQLPKGSAREEISAFDNAIHPASLPQDILIRGADLMVRLRQQIESSKSSQVKLTLLDISVILERFTLRSISGWNPESIKDELAYGCYLSQLSYATGYLYQWESDELLSHYSSIPEEVISLEQLMDLLRATKRNINWGSGLLTTEFSPVVDQYHQFEPMAQSFIDDRIRSGALLYLGNLTARMTEAIAVEAGWETSVFTLKSATIQGINPGFAKGKLIVVEQLDESEVDPQAIYVFKKSPPDLEPVAGILSISEGNVVSHLQLLARNLGIPNATISEADYNRFLEYNGKEIFYAVSNRGGVLVKTGNEMTNEEMQLFAKKEIDEEVIRIPTESLSLDNPRVLRLTDIKVTDTGTLCGPKAANFARLKELFPKNLVDGLVIPFSVFKEHMDLIIPGKTISYWQFLGDIFKEVKRMKSEGAPEENIEMYTFKELRELRDLIKTLPLKDSFVGDLESQFESEFRSSLGETPVFLRSDTNMEDLKDFTGAGLNLTVFNTIDKAKVLQGIRDIWASPYTERSYKWRQKFLSNPEDVYPSILVIPSVFVDYSGVVISKDFVEGLAGRLNVAFSQGVGGAVDGQKSESWILSPDGADILISPARDRKYKALSRTGGTVNLESSLSKRILTEENIRDIWTICATVYSEMPKTGMEYPYDIELGFENDKLWLFQIRPFVENKKATSSIYLSKLDPEVPIGIKFKMNEDLF